MKAKRVLLIWRFTGNGIRVALLTWAQKAPVQLPASPKFALKTHGPTQQILSALAI